MKKYEISWKEEVNCNIIVEAENEDEAMKNIDWSKGKRHDSEMIDDSLDIFEIRGEQ